MPEWVLVGYLMLSLVTLVCSLVWVQGRDRGERRSAGDVARIVAFAVLMALLMMVPLFYLAYLGMVPKWQYGAPYIAVNLLLPLVWAHLAVWAWGTGKTAWARYAPGLGFFLTVPVTFAAVAAGGMLRFPDALRLLHCALFAVGLVLWLKDRELGTDST